MRFGQVTKNLKNPEFFLVRSPPHKVLKPWTIQGLHVWLDQGLGVTVPSQKQFSGQQETA